MRTIFEGTADYWDSATGGDDWKNAQLVPTVGAVNEQFEVAIPNDAIYPIKVTAVCHTMLDADDRQQEAAIDTDTEGNDRVRTNEGATWFRIMSEPPPRIALQLWLLEPSQHTHIVASLKVEDSGE